MKYYSDQHRARIERRNAAISLNRLYSLAFGLVAFALLSGLWMAVIVIGAQNLPAQ